MDIPKQTALDLVQLDIHDASKNLASAIKRLKEWNAQGMSIETNHAEALLEILLKHTESAFERLAVDTALSGYTCSKNGSKCECKGYHRADIAHNHCICGHSQMDHSIRVD